MNEYGNILVKNYWAAPSAGKMSAQAVSTSPTPAAASVAAAAVAAAGCFCQMLKVILPCARVQPQR